jgi:hypothetical protein
MSQLRDRYDAKMQEKIKPNDPEIEAAIVSDLCELQDEIDDAVRGTSLRSRAICWLESPAVMVLADQLPARGETAAEFLRQRTGPPQDRGSDDGDDDWRDGHEYGAHVDHARPGCSLNVAATGFIAMGVGAVAALPVGVAWWRLQRSFASERVTPPPARVDIECLSSANGEISLDLDRIFRQALFSSGNYREAMADALQTATEARMTWAGRLTARPRTSSASIR